ncbi:MAG: hypothetical protein EXS05_12360 [Planctomycetaceae bacterium]|nr:hypothetical protein [Planctomycetaceae bacterium]
MEAAESIVAVCETTALAIHDSRGRNNLRHGCFSIGKMPRGASYVAKMLGILRRKMIDELKARGIVEAGDKEAGDKIPLMADALVNEVLRHERRALLLSRWLRVADDDPDHALSILERAAVLREISGATTARNKCLRELGFAAIKTDADPWLAIHATPVNALQPPPAPTIKEPARPPAEAIVGSLAQPQSDSTSTTEAIAQVGQDDNRNGGAK